MSRYRVAGAQIAVSSRLQDNLPGILAGIQQAADAGAAFVLFPEMALTGYHGDFDQDERNAVLKQICNRCAESGVAALVGAGHRTETGIYNQLVAIDDQGRIIGAHSKLVPTEGDRRWCRPGEELRTFQHRRLRFGMLICNDLWVTPGCGPYPDPRLTYQLAQRDARVIFHAVNSGAKPEYIPYHESNLALRACESQLYIVVANAAPADGSPVNCRSGVVGPDGLWRLAVDRCGEQFFVCDIEVEAPGA